MSLMIYSYDIFDTCLLRACGFPLNVFDILAHRILGNYEATCIVDFAKERADGELRARKALPEGHEYVTIQEIYDYCDFSVWTDVSKETILATELKIERELLSPVFSIREQIRKQRDVVMGEPSNMIHTYPLVKMCASCPTAFNVFVFMMKVYLFAKRELQNQLHH